MNEKYKDVTVGGTVFRIGLFTPKVGSFVVMQFQSRTFLANEDVFNSIRSNVLSVCSVYKTMPDETVVPVTVFRKEDEQWMVPDIPEINCVDFQKLMLEVIDFNMAPYRTA